MTFSGKKGILGIQISQVYTHGKDRLRFEITCFQRRKRTLEILKEQKTV